MNEGIATLSPGDDKVIAITHSLHGLDDLALIILDDLYTLEVLKSR